MIPMDLRKRIQVWPTSPEAKERLREYLEHKRHTPYIHVDRFLLADLEDFAEHVHDEQNEIEESVSRLSPIEAPSNMYDVIARGYRRLAAALLGEAIDTATRPITTYAAMDRTKTAQREQIEDQAWVASQEGYPYSFVWCCQLLGFDADAIREQVVKAIQEQRHLRVRLRGGPFAGNEEAGWEAYGEQVRGAEPEMETEPKTDDANAEGSDDDLLDLDDDLEDLDDDFENEDEEF